MKAILVTGGKQYRVSEGDSIYVEKLAGNEGETITFDEILAIFDEDKVKIGTPAIEGVTVSGKIIKHDKAKKIIVYKMKPKKTYRRKQGHRQPYTKIEIVKINVPS